MEDAAGEPITTSNSEHTSSLLVTTMRQHFKPNTRHTHLSCFSCFCPFFFFCWYKSMCGKRMQPHTFCILSWFPSWFRAGRKDQSHKHTHACVRAHTDTLTVLSCEAAALEHAQQMAPRLTKYDTAFFFCTFICEIHVNRTETVSEFTTKLRDFFHLL